MIACTLTLPTLAGCALFSSDRPAPGRVQEFTAAVERVHVEAELARERSADAVTALRMVAFGEFGDDPVPAYEQLMQAIGRSEGQADVLAEAVASMHAASQPVFQNWAQDLEAIQDPALRQRGAARLQAARERYRSIVDAIEPAVARNRSLNQRLRDHALFLGHDLNPAALADVRPGVQAAQQDGTALLASFDQALAAARSYLEVSSLPVGTPTAPETTAPTGTPAAPAGEIPATDRQPVRLDGQRSGRR
ncbi:MAG: DUF2959 family protein [Planctomycetota bacterium]